MALKTGIAEECRWCT